MSTETALREAADRLALAADTVGAPELREPIERYLDAARRSRAAERTIEVDPDLSAAAELVWGVLTYCRLPGIRLAHEGHRMKLSFDGETFHLHIERETTDVPATAA